MKSRIKFVTTVWMIALVGSFGGWNVAAARDTPAPEPTAEVTSVVVVPPDATETAPVEPSNPRGGLTWEAILPYAFLGGLVLILAFVALFGTSAVLLYRSAPPALQAVSVSVINSLLNQLKEYAAKTPDTIDDAIAKAFDEKWAELQAEFIKAQKARIFDGVNSHREPVSN